MPIYTIGHSTRTLDELLALLREPPAPPSVPPCLCGELHHRGTESTELGVTRLADIRRYPGSRRHPHFSKESLQRSLPAAGIEYVHFEDLGGRRKPAPDSPNTYWKNPQFRAYADYMATPAFAAAVDRLVATDQPTAVMCAEAVPWRCHRNLLADDLVRRGVEVLHVLGPGDARAHVLNAHARVAGDHVRYDAEQKSLDFGAL